mmetsp:Transcript_51646/g.117607  ORF Transcript_51646/g.117607 Transcript_51646/m.117607 type:complete len:259 (+) Transcript_51646:985-1761(+)
MTRHSCDWSEAIWSVLGTMGTSDCTIESAGVAAHWSCCIRAITSKENSAERILFCGVKVQRSIPSRRHSHSAPALTALRVAKTHLAMSESSATARSTRAYCAETRSPRARAAFHLGEGAPMDSTQMASERTSAMKASSPRRTRFTPFTSACWKDRKGVMGMVHTKDSSTICIHFITSASPAALRSSICRTTPWRIESRSRSMVAASARSRACCSRCAVRSITICESLASYAFLRSRVFRACSRFRSLVTFSLSSNVIS